MSNADFEAAEEFGYQAACGLARCIFERVQQDGAAAGAGHPGGDTAELLELLHRLAADLRRVPSRLLQENPSRTE